jgi:hypothetical protein
VEIGRAVAVESRRDVAEQGCGVAVRHCVELCARRDLHGDAVRIPHRRDLLAYVEQEAGAVLDRAAIGVNPRPNQGIGNQVSEPPFMSGTSRVLPSGMSEMSAADWNLSDRSLGGSLAETNA